MANLNMKYAIWIVFSLLIAALVNVSIKKNIDLQEDEMCLRNEKLAKIVFYGEDVTSGPNPTLYEVARANITTDALMSFGKIYVLDDTITATPPGANPVVLGKSQGIVIFADMAMSSAEMVFNVIFTAGKYNGSTLSFSGHNMVLEQRRQMPVVGGTGIFRFTRGYAFVTIISSGTEENTDVYTFLEYSVSVTFCP